MAFISAAPAQTIEALRNQPPNGASLALQLTDGSVMVQSYVVSDWYKLTPDPFGSYVNGTWTQLASLPPGYEPDAFASAVLADGRVAIVGGEYNFGEFALTNLCAIYDPEKDAWTMIPPPSGWDYIGDVPSVVLPNGLFLVGKKTDGQLAALNPFNLEWTPFGSTGKNDFNSEEGWTLMPDGTVLTADVKAAPATERYLPLEERWISDGNTVQDLHSPTLSDPIPYGNGLVYNPPGEIGPAILRPDGTVFFTGASNEARAHTGVYHPGITSADPGTWTAGPDFPNDEAGDTSAVLLPNGNVLVRATSGTLYEFDGVTLIRGPVLDFDSSFNMMTLPTGQAIITGDTVKIYTSTGSYSPAWAPAITAFPHRVARGWTYRIAGTQFNGLSQAAAFGDEEETATNYPLVCITNRATGHVTFARTHHHSTMGVATGSAIVSTNFDVPAGTETGPSTLQVIANGIPSVPVNIDVYSRTRALFE